MNGRIWMAIGALIAAAGVLLGAYHAHGLRSALERQGQPPDQVERRMHDAEVAVRYQMYHALGLVLLGGLMATRRTRLLQSAAVCMAAGIVLFCGGLYIIVFAGTSIHWGIVPAGGLCLAVSWILAAGAFIQPPPAEPAV